MHCKTLLISLFPLLLPVVHASTISAVNGRNQVLASEAASFDSNVKELGTLSAPLKIQDVVNDVETFATNVGGAATNGQNTAPAEGDDQEETVAEPWSDLSSNTATYMNDLADKAGILILQKATVEASLTKLDQNYKNLLKVVESVESDTDYVEEIDNDAAKAIAKIQVAMAAFE